MGLRDMALTGLLFAAVSTAAFANTAPSIGGGAAIDVSVGEAGVLNAGAMVEGAASIKQTVGSLIEGSVSGTLSDNIVIGQAGVLNAGAMVEGEASICQSVGSIGSDCSVDLP